MGIGATLLIYKGLGEKQQNFPYSAPLTVPGRPIDRVRVYQFQGQEKNILILTKVSNCNDTMSEKNIHIQPL